MGICCSGFNLNWLVPKLNIPEKMFPMSKKSRRMGIMADLLLVMAFIITTMFVSGLCSYGVLKIIKG